MFDTKKLLFVAKNDQKIVKEDDDFNNQDNIFRLKDNNVCLLSGNYANITYIFENNDSMNLKCEIRQMVYE